MIKPPKKPPKMAEEAVEEKFTGPMIYVKKITLTGVETFSAKDFDPITKKYEKRDVAEGELKQKLAKDIEREYLKKGVIAACFVPPQEIKDGKVELRVVEARMGDLVVKKHRYFVNERINYYWTTKPGQVLRYDKMARSLQLMNKNPDREVSATLYAGKKPGTTDIQLTPKTYLPAHFTMSLDREGIVPTGRVRKGFGGIENNLLGLDDTLMAGYLGGKDFGGVYAYHGIPITNYGTTLLYGFNKTKAFPKKDFEQYGISSTAEDYSGYIYQDLYYKEAYQGEVSFGLEARNKRTVSNDGTLTADRLRVTRLGLGLLDRDVNNVTYIKPEFSQGLNLLGARRKSEFSSRQAENTFSKFTLNARFLQNLVKGFQANLKFSGQLASEKLMPQEELYLGGIDSVRGYPSGDYLADTGFYTNCELLIPAFFVPEWMRLPYGERPIKDEITGVLFFDYGYGEKRGMIEGEQSKRELASVGAGIRIKLFNQGTLRLEWGFPLDRIANLPLTEFDRSRFHFSFDFQDKLPREIERLQEEFKKDPPKKKFFLVKDPATKK